MAEPRRTILLTGASGQVGEQLLTMLRSFGPVAAPKRQELDLRDGDKLRRFIRDVRPRWIVNAAAYTAVDKAESERDAAFAVNATAVLVISEEAARLGAPVVHFSTDYVFGGSGSAAWTEGDEPNPLNVYGASKLQGERMLASVQPAHFIFRTSWLYGATGRNFLRTILQAARERDEIKVVADQHGAPTWSHDLASGVLQAMQQVEREARERSCDLIEAIGPMAGIYHACAAGETTWFGFAEELVRLARQAEPERRFAALVPIPSADYPTAAKRPANSRLSCEKLKRNLELAMPEWKQSVASVMDSLDTAK